GEISNGAYTNIKNFDIVLLCQSIPYEITICQGPDRNVETQLADLPAMLRIAIVGGPARQGLMPM
ncbi:MAG: hypothetical protein COV41_01380, partial [Candidatus Brennerbacteria bacterium CG11_big_fil_rev_8_21_14_0_20_43_10]